MVTGFIGHVIQFLLISRYRQYKRLQICEVRVRSCLLGVFLSLPCAVSLCTVS